MWAFTSCTNEIEGTGDIMNDSVEVTISVNLPQSDETRLTYDDDVNHGLYTYWEEGDQLVAYNNRGTKSAVFRLASGIGKLKATFTTNAKIQNGDYRLVYVPKNGVIKNTFAAMIGYYDEVVLTQWESGDTDHLKGGEQYCGNLNYIANADGTPTVVESDITLQHRLATLSLNLTAPIGAENHFITSVIVYNGSSRHEINVNDIIWNDVVRVHMFMYPQDAVQRDVKFFVNTVAENSASVPTTYSQEMTTNKAHLAGRRYSLDLNDLK